MAEQVTTKDPKKVEMGKRLAEYNRRKREEHAQLTKARSESKLSQYYSVGAIVAKLLRRLLFTKVIKLWFTNLRIYQSISLKWSRL